MAKDCYATQLISGYGKLNAAGLRNFIDSVKLHECGLSYAVVAIMGPESSGKSTLLNHLFYTNFGEMDAIEERQHTRNGIWIAKAAGIEPLTVVMDLEGTDSRERGEDDTTFEKQSALFALALADIVLINMWFHDIGREQAANRPLLRTVFQTPLRFLELILRDDVQKVWETVRKPEVHKDTPLSEFFNVEVTALSSYEEKESQFKEQVAQLRRRLSNSVSPGGLAGDRRGVAPGSGFSFSLEKIWKIIKENKDLDLPPHKVMVATVQCEEIANDKFTRLESDEDWLALERVVQNGAIPHFGRSISSILQRYLSDYDVESAFFEKGVRNTKRQYLEANALQLFHQAFITTVGHVRSNVLHSFQTQLENPLDRGHGVFASVVTLYKSSLLKFDKECADAAVQKANWDASKARTKLMRDIEAHLSLLFKNKLQENIVKCEKQLSKALIEPLEPLFEAGGTNMWASIRRLLKQETEVAMTAFFTAMADFELDQETADKMTRSTKDFARNLVEKKAREEARKVLIRMKLRFLTVFNHDKDFLPRVWTGKEDIQAITREARLESVKLLSTMAAIRLDESTDTVENVLVSTLMDETVSSPSKNKEVGFSGDPLASSTWEEIPPEKTLITPVQCKVLWKQFKAETEYTITQAISAQESYKHENNRSPTILNLIKRLARKSNASSAPKHTRRPTSSCFRNQTQNSDSISREMPDTSVSSDVTTETGFECSRNEASNETRNEDAISSCE